jgi:hypothetical protein
MESLDKVADAKTEMKIVFPASDHGKTRREAFEASRQGMAERRWCKQALLNQRTMPVDNVHKMWEAAGGDKASTHLQPPRPDCACAICRPQVLPYLPVREPEMVMA